MSHCLNCGVNKATTVCFCAQLNSWSSGHKDRIAKLEVLNERLKAENDSAFGENCRCEACSKGGVVRIQQLTTLLQKARDWVGVAPGFTASIDFVDNLLKEIDAALQSAAPSDKGGK